MKDRLIAVVDDDPDMIRMLELNLKDDGHRVRGFSDAEGLFQFLQKEKPDLIILDLMLPDMSGFAICKTLKKKEKFASIPVIILSGRSEEADKVLGLDVGSDDYMVKPCSFDELKARIRAVLRRRGGETEAKIIKVGRAIAIDVGRHEVTVYGKKVSLTSAEFGVLECLASRKGQVFTRGRILSHLWGEEKTVVGRTIDVHIRHLRKKLGKGGKLIKSIRGMGYKLEEDD
ncbi:response regulator transcription factor [Candidatus Omnitrophota bacterium]